MHATWQALQPMHLVTSISLATWPAGAPRASGDGRVVAERRTISSDCNAMVSLLSPLDLDQNALRLGRLRVAVADRVGQGIGQIPRLGRAEEAPVDRDADLMQGLAFDLQRLDALGHHRDRLDMPALGTDLDPAAV